MNCFQLIKTVLDEAYEDIPGAEEDKDKLIRQYREELRKRYQTLTTAGAPSYSDPAMRFAYIYTYTTSHANIVYDLILESDALRECFDAELVRVSCVGGGPGSDFLGVYKYLQKAHKEPQLVCNLLDRETAWDECWIDVDEKIGAKDRISTHFRAIDVTNPETWAGLKKYLNSDVFTLIYFMSELYSVKTSADPYFAHFMKSAKPGSLILFVDNRDSLFYGWFDKLANENGLTIIESAVGKAQMPWDEEKTDLGDYFARFGDPKLTGSIAYRVARKE